MVSITESNQIDQKTRELCEAILATPDFSELTGKIETFLANQQAKDNYILVSERGDELHRRQHAGEQITESEATEFQAMRDTMMTNSVIADFLSAQDSLNHIHSRISKHVTKTIELGRLPTEEDLASNGGCGSGCGCH